MKMISIRLSEKEEERVKSLGLGYTDVFRLGLWKEDMATVKCGEGVIKIYLGYPPAS
jgi:hypothetical protein